jgi:hypothetical protein
LLFFEKVAVPNNSLGQHTYNSGSAVFDVADFEQVKAGNEAVAL